MAGRGIAARAMDFLQNGCGLDNTQSGAAVFFRDERGHVPGFSERLNKCLRISALAIQCTPVGIREVAAQFADGTLQFLAQTGMSGGRHRRGSERCYGMAYSNSPGLSIAIRRLRGQSKRPDWRAGTSVNLQGSGDKYKFIDMPGSQLFQVETLDNMNATFHQQVHMDRHGARGDQFKVDGV